MRPDVNSWLAQQPAREPLPVPDWWRRGLRGIRNSMPAQVRRALLNCGPTGEDTAHSSTRTMPPRLRPSPSGSCPEHQASQARGMRESSITSILRSRAPTLTFRISTGAAWRSSTTTAAKPINESFLRLQTSQQDAVIRALEEGTATGFTWPTAQEFFNTIRTHTMEGMFADPIYGGNKDFAGWRLVGFPGAQPVFTPADMQSRQAFARAPIIGLQAQGRKP